MRILVVTLHAGENEFERCVESIRRQTHPIRHHLVVEGLPVAEAHEVAYSYFYSRPSEFDLMVKVDADMVLHSDRLFEGIVRRFTERPDLMVLGIAVEDFFTGGSIWGLNSYRNGLAWKGLPDPVYADRLEVPPGATELDDRVLAPAAVHAPDPSPFQAFHYGVHRGSKVRYALSIGNREWASLRLLDLHRTWRNAGRRRDRRLYLAALGGELALAGTLGWEAIDYSHPRARELFSRVESWPAGRLRRAVVRLRRVRGGWLPPDLRLLALEGRPPGSWVAAGVRLALRRASASMRAVLREARLAGAAGQRSSPRTSRRNSRA